MRLLHTSDWHLGHTLRGEVSREYEHAAFLGWLLDACVREAADALVITGDVFDSATPPASAERMWFEFLAAARRGGGAGGAGDGRYRDRGQSRFAGAARRGGVGAARARRARHRRAAAARRR